MPSQPDFFMLFQLPARFALDLDALEQSYRSVQAQVHPDRFGAASGAEKRVAMQWAAHANEAVGTLRSPVKRAAYLCELHGVPIAAESNTAMPAAFLLQQMQWREALEDTADRSALERLRADVDGMRAELLAQLADALDARGDYAAAAALVRQLMFVEKFSGEVAAAFDKFDEQGRHPRSSPADAGERVAAQRPGEGALASRTR